MYIHLRQICLVAEKLGPVLEGLTTIFGVNPCYVDPAVKMFGLENTLLAIGTNFLEVVAPIQDNTAAGRYLERRKGDGGYMVICQVASRADQQAVRERAAQNGVRIAFEHAQDDHAIMQLHPGDMRASFLEADWDAQEDMAGNWHPADGLNWQSAVKADVTRTMVGATLQGPDPMSLAQHWGAVMGLETGVMDGVPVLNMANGQLRFVPDSDGRGPGLKGITLDVVNIDHVRANADARGCLINDHEVEVCGTRFYLRG